MKKCLVTVMVLACTSGVALAGPNAGGTIFAHDADLVYTPGTTSYCGLGTPPISCEEADVQIDGTSDVVHKVWGVYAAFPDGSSPRLKGLVFGIHYDPRIIVSAAGACSEFWLDDPGWPGNGTGTALVFEDTQTSQLVEVYWFAGYSYAATGSIFQLGPSPSYGDGMFADDALPPQLDQIVAYGSIGFGTAGQTSCAWPVPYGGCCMPPCGETCSVLTLEECENLGGWSLGAGTGCDPNPCLAPFGACCLPDGRCEFTCELACRQDGGVWIGGNCDPNPCDPTALLDGSWGRIKLHFRTSGQ